MARGDDDRRSGQARDAAQALLQAVRVLRQHGDQPRLGESAIRRCVTAVRAAAANAPLVVPLRAGSAAAVSTQGLICIPGEVPFGALLAAGFGEIAFAADVAAEDVERFVRMLAASDTTARGPAGLPQRLVAAAIAGVRLRAAPSPVLAAPVADFALLPPTQAPGALRPQVARDLAANLPLHAAGFVLADLADAPRRYQDRLARHLEPLVCAMLERGDATSATWLLEQVAANSAVPPPVAAELRRAADRHCDPGWFTTQLATASQQDVFALLALAMQLGDRALVDLAAAARDMGHPHAPWILEVLGN